MEQNGTELKVLPLLATPEQPSTSDTYAPLALWERGRG